MGEKELTAEEQAAVDRAVYVALMEEQLRGLEAQIDRGESKRRAEEVRARLAELAGEDLRVAGAAKETRLRGGARETRKAG